MKEYEVETWEVNKTMRRENLDYEQAAAYIALKYAGYIYGSDSWEKYEAENCGEPTESITAGEFQTNHRNRMEDEVCQKYFEQYGNVAENHGSPFTQEAVDALPEETILVFYPDWDEWSHNNEDYVNICKYYGIRVSIKVC